MNSNSVLEDKLRAFFKERFGAPVGGGEPAESGNVFCFEWLPRTVSVDEAFLDNAVPRVYAPAKADEYFSTSLVDPVGYVAGDYRKTSLQSVISTYADEVVRPARFAGQLGLTDAEYEEALKAFTDLKAEAEKRIREAKRAIPDFAAADFFVTFAEPSNWLDPAADGTWTSHSMTIEAAQPTTPGQPVKPTINWRRLDAAKLSGADLTQFIEKVPDTSPVEVQPVATTAGLTAIAAHAHAHSTHTHLLMPAHGHGMHLAAAAAAASTAAPATVSPQAAIMGRRAALAEMSPVRASRELMRAAEFEPRLSLEAVTSFSRRRGDFRDKLIQVLEPAVVSETPTQSSTLQVTFSYQIVHVRRSWLYYPFLNHRSWCVPGQTAGAYAGADQEDDDRRPLSLLPAALIFVKDVEITGHWTEADKATLSEAFAVGPFAFHGNSAMVDQTLKQPGITLFATINVRLPMIPPQSSPVG